MKRHRKSVKRPHNLDDQAEYEVEAIEGCRYSEEKDCLEYLIKWKGYDEDTNSWEQESNLSCPTLVNSYHKKHGSKASYFNRQQSTTSSSDYTFVPKDKIDQLLLADLQPTFQDRWIIEKSDKGVYNVRQRPITPYRDSQLDVGVDEKTLRQPKENKNEAKDLRFYFNAEPLDCLEQWLRKANRACAINGEAQLRVENNVDNDHLPLKDFVYVTHLRGNEVKIPDDPLVGCACRPNDSCKPGDNCCVKEMNGEFAYSAGGFVRINPGRPIYECHSKCLCSSACTNRVVQKGRQVELCVFKTADGRGWGVKSIGMIQKGAFVGEYVGEVITVKAAEERPDSRYMFNMDFAGTAEYIVDAKYYGGVTRFINHSCDPNLVVYSVWIEHYEASMPRLAFFAQRDIPPGEELTYDYFKQRNENKEASSNDSSDDEQQRGLNNSQNPQRPSLLSIVCKCGKTSCRQPFFQNDKR